VKERITEKKFKPYNSKEIWILKSLPNKLKGYLTSGVLTMSALMAFTTACEADSQEGDFEFDQPKASRNLNLDEQETSNEELVLPVDNPEDSFYSGGPHPSDIGGLIENSLDFTFGRTPVVCPGGDPIEDRWVVASSAGEVVLVGDRLITQGNKTTEEDKISKLTGLNGIVV